MFRRTSQVVFTFLAIVRSINAVLTFNAPSAILEAAESMSVDQCGTSHNIKDVSVSSSEGQIPIFRITRPAGAHAATFGVYNNEQLRCIEKDALKAAGLAEFNLNIEVSSATESAISFTFVLTVTGLDTNPNTPTFSPTSISVTVSRQKFAEDGEFTLPQGFVVSDPDKGQAGNVTISLKGSPAEFSISRQSNNVSIQVKRSTLALVSPYELVVIATDQGTPSKTGSATMTITLECAMPSFGQNCSHICNCIHDSDCDPINGKCDLGQCKPGWQGSSCDQECATPTFGQNCSSICHCLSDNHCDPVDGKCESGLCGAGWQGPSCDQECSSPYYGQNCSHICNCINDSHCDPVDGKCDSGLCKTGWQGPSCNKECATPTFGQNCSHICNCINDSHCDPVDGKCDFGLCKAGWQGSSCNKECVTPSFGQDCSSICHCINDSHCDPVDGQCDSGLCKAEWEGPSCDNQASGKLKIDQEEQDDTVLAALLIVLAVFVVVCVVVIVCLLRKKTRCMSYHLEDSASSGHKMVEVSEIDQY